MNGRECVLLSIILVCMCIRGAKKLWALLTVTSTHVGGQPAEVRGGRGHSQVTVHTTSCCPLPFPSSLPLLLWHSSGLVIFCVQCIMNFWLVIWLINTCSMYCAVFYVWKIPVWNGENVQVLWVSIISKSFQSFFSEFWDCYLFYFSEYWRTCLWAWSSARKITFIKTSSHMYILWKILYP
jgi:hypothetical protein